MQEAAKSQYAGSVMSLQSFEDGLPRVEESSAVLWLVEQCFIIFSALLKATLGYGAGNRGHARSFQIILGGYT